MSKEALLNKFKKKIAAGTVICKEGDASESFLILIAGKVGIYKGESKIAVVEEAGSYIGEMAAILKEPRSATMKTETEIVAYIMPGGNLSNLISASPAIGLKLIKSFAERLRSSDGSGGGGVETEALGDYKALVFILEKVYEKKPDPFMEAIIAFAKRSPLINSEAEFNAPLEDVTKIISLIGNGGGGGTVAAAETAETAADDEDDDW